MEDLLTHIQNITGTGEQSQEAAQNQAPTPAAEEQQPVQEAQPQEQQAGADGVIDTGADLLTKLQYYTSNTAGNGSDTQKQAVVPEEQNQAQEAEPAVAPALGAKGNVAQAAVTGNRVKADKGNGVKADTRPYSAGTLAEVTVTSNAPKVRRQAAENATKAIVQAQKIKGSDFIFNGKFFDKGYADGYGKTPEQIANLINETNNSNMEYNQAYARILGLADALSPKGQHKTAAEHLGDMAGLPQKSKEILRQIVRGEGDYDTSDPYKSLDAKIANEAWADVEKQIAANEKAAQRELNSTPYYAEAETGKSMLAGIERNKTDMMKSVNKAIDAHKDEYLATIAAYASKYCNGNMEQAADKVRGGIIEAVKKRFVPNLSGAGFVLEGGVWDSIIGKLMRWGTNLASGVKEGEFHPNQAFDEALQKYGEKAGLWANLGKEAVSLSLDMPFMGAALKGASFVTNPFFKFGGSALAKGLPKSVKYFKEVIENAPAAGRAMQMTKAGRFIVGGVQQGLAGSIYSGADALLSQKAAGQDLDWAKAFEASKEGSASWALMSTVPYVGNYVNRVIEKGIPGIGKAATASRNVMKAFNEFGVVPAAMTAAMIGPGGDFSSPNIASSYLMSLFFAGKGMYDRGTYVGRDGREHKNIVVGASRIFTMNPMQKADFGFTKEELKSLNATSTFNLFRRIVNGEKIPIEELMPDYKAGESSSTSVGDYSKSRSEMWEKVKGISDKGIFKELYELLGNPNIPFSAKDKLCYVFTGVHTQRPTILGLRQIDNEDGTQSIYTVDCNDMPIDRFDFKEGKDGNLGGEAKNTFRRLANIVLHNQINVLEKKIYGNLMANALTKAMQDLSASTGGSKYAAELSEEMKRLSDKLSRGEKLTADERKEYNQMYRQVEHEMNAALESSIVSIRKQIADAYGISLSDFENILGRNVLNDGERSMVQKYYTQLNREIGAPTSEFGGQPRETRKMTEQGGDGLNDVEVSATDNGGGSNDVVTEEPPKEPVKPVKPEQPIDTPTAEKPHVEGVQEKQETVEPKPEQSAQPTEPNVEPEQGKTGTTKQEKEEPVKPSDVGANVDDYKALTKDAEANPEDPEVQEAVNALEEQRKAALDYFNNGEKGEAPTNYDYWKQRMRLGEEVDEPTQPEQKVEPEQPKPEQPKQQTPEEPKQPKEPSQKPEQPAVMPAGLRVRKSDLTKITQIKGYATGTYPSEIKVVGVDNIAEDAETGGVAADVTFEYPTKAGADGKKGTARVTKRVALVRLGQVPYKTEQTKHGVRSYYLDTVINEDGTKVTSIRVERGGQEIITPPNAYFPMPEGYEPDPEYLGEGDYEVLGIHELRETKDGLKIADVVVKGESGVYKLPAKLRPVEPKEPKEPTSEQPEQPKEIVPDVTQEGTASEQHEAGGGGKPDVEAIKEKIAEIKGLDKLWKPLKDKNTEEAKSINGKLRKAKSELRSLLMKMSLAQLEELEDKEGEWEGTSLGYRSARDVFSNVLDYKQGEARIEERVEESKQIEPKKPQKKVAPMDFSYLDYGKESGMNYAVYHEGGFVVGTNNHIIYARREDYPAELEGKMTDKKGRITGGSLPMPWREVLPEDEQTEPLEVDIDGLHRFVAGVRATDKSEYAHVGIKLPDGRILFYGAKRLDLFLRAARASGAKVMLTGEDAGYKRDSLSFHTDDAAGMIMPSNKDAIYSSNVDNAWVYDASGAGTKGDGQDRPIAKENGTEESEQPAAPEKPAEPAKPEEKETKPSGKQLNPVQTKPDEPKVEIHEVDINRLFKDLNAYKTARLSDYFKDKRVGEDFDSAMNEAHDKFLSQLNTFKEKPTREMLEAALKKREKWAEQLANLFKSGKSEGVFNGKRIKNVDVFGSMANVLGQRKALQELLGKSPKSAEDAQQRPTEQSSHVEAVHENAPKKKEGGKTVNQPVRYGSGGYTLRPARQEDFEGRHTPLYVDGKQVHAVIFIRTGEQVSATQFSAPRVEAIVTTNDERIPFERLEVEDVPKTVHLKTSGNFYEAYGNEAVALGRATGMTIIENGGQKTAGFPRDYLDEVEQKLRDAGFDVSVDGKSTKQGESTEKPKQEEKKQADERNAEENASPQQEKPSKGRKSKEKTVSSQEQGVKPSAVSPEGEKPVKERPSKELSGDSDKFQKQAKSEQDFVGRIKGMIADAAKEGKSLTMADIKRAYEEERGRNSDLPSDYRDTDLQELVERAMTLATRDIAVESLSKNTPEAVRDGYDRIVQLYNSQPSLNSRDSSRMEHQQYSTPTPFAYLMDWFLRHGKTPHSGLEPSAGNGALTIGFPASIWHVNDIDERRLMNLRTMPYGKITNQDGTMPFEPKAYDMVATNPPFGTTTEKTFDGGKTKINSLEGLMAINALLSMKDDGRAAIIIGGNTSYMSNGAMQSKDMKLFRHLYTHYNVVDVINLNGDMYKRNGTGYDVRIILIDGRRTDVPDNPEKFTYPPVRDKARAEQVRTFDELYKRIEDDIQHSLSQRLQSESPDTEHRVGGESGHRDENRPEDNRQRPVSDEQPVRGRPMGGSPQPAISPADAEDGGRTGVGGEQAQISGLDNDDRRNELGAGGVRPGEPTKERGASNRGGIGGDNRTGIPNNDNSNGRGLAVSEPQKKLNGNEDKAVGLGQEKVSYRPKSKSITFQSQVPAEQAEAIESNLDKIGDVDDFLTKELGYSSKDELFSHLSAEQIDGVALAINQMKAGKGFIIGDMTGIGKGRQGAALIRWAINQGKTPIYFTQKARLFTDNYRDMCDIGSKGLRPFIMSSNKEAPITEIVVDKNGEVVYDDNGKVKTRVVYGIPTKQESERVYKYVLDNGKLPPEYDYVLVTYSQVSTGTTEYVDDGKGKIKKKTKKSKGKTSQNEINGDIRRNVIEKLSANNYILLDESHTVGGQSSVGYYMQDILKNVAGVTYMSATFAKRPDNMPLYAMKTAMSESGLSQNKMIEAIQKGGVTLQEVMSKQLSQSGQMIRRERDFSGVSIDWEGVDPQTDKKQRAQFDEVSKLFNEIKDFQDTYVDPYINEVSNELATTGSYAVRTRGTSHLGVSNVPFASKMFNLVNQLLFALKVDAVADRAIAALKENQKPVISFTNTMEGFLKELPKGEQMEEAPDFSMTLMRALEGTLKYSEGDAASGEEQKKMLSLSELGKEAQDKYNEIRRHILGLGAGLPIDPLDAIKMKIEDAGYKVGEISGRKIEIVRDGEGKYVVQPRSGKDSKAVANAFNNGGIDVVFVNKSGSTGISLHASSKFGDTRQRIMIAAQFQMDINDEVQMRGRIDRTGQVQRGRYVYIMSSIPAEQRLQMMFKNKLKSLDANTTSSQKSKFNEMEVTDFMNKYGDKIVWDYMQEHPELEDRLGDPLKMFDTNGNVKEDNGSAKDDKVAPDSAAIILRRLPFLSVAEQESIFNDISEAYAVKMKLLDDAGENDLEITTMPLRAKTESKSMWVHGTNPGSGNSFADNTYLEKVEVDVLKKPMKAKEVKEYVERLTGGEDWLTWHASKHEEIAKYFDEKRKAVSDKMSAAMKNKAEKKRAEFIKGAIKVREKEGSGITDEEISRAAEKAVNDYISREQAKIDKRLNDISKQENRIYETFDYFKPYEAYVIPLNLTDRQGSLVMPSTGTFIGIKFNKSYSLSSSTAVFATLDGRRKVELPLNDEDSLSNIRKQSIMMSYEKRGLNMDNWDSRVPTNSRKTAYIVTGNLMQALVDTQKDNKTKGQLISYTTIDGEVKQGILMNSRFKEEDLYISVPIYTQREKIKQGDLVESEDGEVSIGRSYNGIGGVFKLSVPKSKAKGGKYFLDNKLRGMIQSGEFETRGNKMVGWITADKLDDVLVYLSKSLGVKVKQNTSYGDGGSSYSNDTRGYTTTGSEGAGSGHAERADVEQAVADVDKRTGGNTAVIDSSEVPADVVKKLGEGVKGYVKGGKAYVVADNCDSAAEAATVAVHESAGHINMRNYLGDKAGEFYQSVFDNVMSEADRAAWKQATKGESDTEAAEEFVADQARLAATGKPSIWSRIVGRFREFLWRHFGIHPSLKTVDYMLWKATQQARGRDHGVLYENENMFRDKARGEYTSEAQREIADAEEIRGYTEARSEEQYAADFNNFMGERKVGNEEEIDRLADELEQLKQEKREMTQNAISGHSMYTGDDFKRKRLEIRLAEAQKKELEAENNLLDKLLGAEGDTRRRARGGAGSLYDATSKDERQPLDVSLAAADANILKAKLEAEMFAKEHPAEGMSEVEKRHYENLLAEQSIAKLRKQQIEMTPPVLEQPEMPKGAPKYPTFDRDENNPEVYEKAIEKYNQEKKEYEDKLAEYDDAMYENEEKFKEWKIEQGKIAAKITALRLGNKLDEAKEHFAQNWAKPGERDGLYESLSAITGIDLTGKGKNIKHVINDFYITRRKLLNRRNAEDERIIGEVERAVREFVGNRIKRGLQAAGRKIGGIVAPEKTRPTGASLNSVAEVNRALIDMVEGTMETPEELKPVVEKIRHYFDDVFNWLAEEGMANPYQRRKNYVPHVWDMEKSDISRDLLTKLQGMEAAEIQRRYEGMTNDEAEAQIKMLNTQLRRIKLDYDGLKARRSGYEKGMSEYNELSDQMKAVIDDLNRVKRQMSELRRYIGMQNLRLRINSKLYEGDEATEVQDWLTTRSRFMQERELDSYAEGIRGGLVPKYDSITDLMRYYGGQSNQAVANRDLIDLLKNVNYVDANGGKHPLIKEIDDRPTEGYVTLPNKALHGYEVLAGPKNRYLGYLNVLFGSKRIFGSSGDWLQSIGAAVDVLNSIAKTGQLTLSGFHHIALSEGFLGMSHGHGLPWLSVNKGADGKHKIRFTAGGPIEGIYGMVIKTIATGELPSTRMPELVDDAVYHLVKLGATGDYNAKETASILQNLADKFGNMASAEWKAIVNSRNEQEYSNSVAKFIDKIGVKRLHKYLSIGALHAGRTAVSTLNSALEINNWILWDLVHDSVKLMAYRDRAAQIRKQAEAQGWTQKELDGVLDELGQFINDTFGGQNWETMMASKKVLRAFQFTFLSPDWNFSAMRHFSSLVGGGRLYNYDPWYKHVSEVSMLRLKKMLAGQSPFKSAHSLGADMGAVTRKSLGRTCIAASAFLLSAAYSFMQLYNRYKDEQRAAKQEGNPYKEAYGDDWKPLDLSTKEGWYDALSRGDEWIVYPWNTMNAPGRSTYLFLGRGDDGTERYMRWGKQYREIFDLLISETGAFDPFTGINKIIGKTSPVLQFVPNVLTGRSLTADDWADNKDITEADNWKDATTSRLTAMAQMFSPYSLRQKNKGFVVAQLMMPVSKGLTIGKAVPLLVKAIDSGDMRLVERVRRSVYLSGLDYKKVQDMANMQVETRRTEEMKKSIGSPEQALIEWQKSKAKGDSKGMEKYENMYKRLTDTAHTVVSEREALEDAKRILKGDYAEGQQKLYDSLKGVEDVREDTRLSRLKSNLQVKYEQAIPFVKEIERMAEDDNVSYNTYKAYQRAHRADFISYLRYQNVKAISDRISRVKSYMKQTSEGKIEKFTKTGKLSTRYFPKDKGMAEIRRLRKMALTGQEYDAETYDSPYLNQ